MCGIYAIKWDKNRPKKFELLKRFIEISRRGQDAWGIAIGTESSLENLYKSPRSISSLKSIYYLYRHLNFSKNKGWIISHARLSTSGYSGLYEHNHPIKLDDIVLVHNGLVVGRTKNTLPENICTDSQQLAIKIQNTKNVNLLEMLNEQVGEINICWYDIRKNQLNAYTNNGNMYLTQNESRVELSSEPISTNSVKLPLRTIYEF